MSFSVNTNNNALAALESLNVTQQAMTKTQNRVSSGLKVAGAADDASTFAIAQGQRGAIAGFNSVSTALGMGSAVVTVALQGAQTISDMLNQVEGKVVQAQDKTQDAKAIQTDITSLLNQIDATASAAQFNGVNLITGGSGVAAANLSVLSSLNGTGTGTTPAYITVQGQGLDASSLQIGGINVASSAAQITLSPAGSNLAAGDALNLTVTDGVVSTNYEFQFPNAGSVDAGATTVALGTTLNDTMTNLMQALQSKGFSASYDSQGLVEISSANGTVTDNTTTASVLTGGTGVADGTAPTANNLTTVLTAIATVKTSLSQLGSASNQIQTQSNFVKNLTDSLTSGVGTLVDADLAAESATLQSLQTKQQLGIQALSIANQGPGAILSLFR